MSKYVNKNYLSSFKYALKGLRLTIKSQKNFRFQLIVAVFCMIAGNFLKFQAYEMCILLFAIGLVLVCEMINSAIEFTLDACFRNKYSTMVGMAKDISAGAVFIATTISIFIGIILFGNSILKFIY